MDLPHYQVNTLSCIFSNGGTRSRLDIFDILLWAMSCLSFCVHSTCVSDIIDFLLDVRGSAR